MLYFTVSNGELKYKSIKIIVDLGIFNLHLIIIFCSLIYVNLPIMYLDEKIYMYAR